MEIVLLENIKNLGKIGDVVNVKRGHGRNFLIKYNKALKASKENIELVNKRKTELNQKNLELKKSAKKISETINQTQYKFFKRAHLMCSHSNYCDDYAKRIPRFFFREHFRSTNYRHDYRIVN